MGNLLNVEKFSVSYGNNTVVREVSFHVDHGETIAIIGANGAGKTSLLRGIMGLEKRSFAKFNFDGSPFEKARCHELVRAGLAVVPEGRRVFADMSVEDNVLAGGHINANRNADIENVYELFPKLRERRNQNAGTLSGGEQQMVSIGRALMSRPKLLLLDEPTLGLAPKICALIEESVKVLGRRGIGIILVEQNSEMAMGIAARSLVLREGRFVREISQGEKIGSEALWQLYTG